MPPRFKFTKEQIIQAALDITRDSGVQAVTARAVALKLEASSKVIFSLFKNMEELQQEVVDSAFKLYQSFISEDVNSGIYPPYKAMGMAYIRFAKEEAELFKLLYMCDRSQKNVTTSADYELAVEIIMKANAISREKAELLHLEMWSCVHGIATMLATSFLTLEWDTISRILTDVYQGTRGRILSEE